MSKSAVTLPTNKVKGSRGRKKIKKIFSQLTPEEKDKLVEELLIRANLIKETEDEEDE